MQIGSLLRMSQPPKALRIGSILWALVIGAGVIALGASILIPSTKRSHMDFRRLHDQELERSAATEPDTRPTTER
jgi:hypothetical protein